MTNVKSQMTNVKSLQMPNDKC